MKGWRPGPCFLLVGAALLLRIGWVGYCWVERGPTLSWSDEELHWQLARNLVEDGTLVSDDGRWAARMPAYPLLLSLFAWLGDAGVLAARLAQAVLGAVTVGVAGRLAAAAIDQRAAWIAGLLVCFDPFAVFAANLLLTEVLFTALLVGLVACGWRLLAAAELDRRALVGLALLGPLALLTRPSSAALVPLVWVVVGWLAADARRVRRWLIVCPIALAVLVLPWGLRNNALLGSCAWLSTNGGVTLYDAQGRRGDKAADGSSNQSFLTDMPELQGLDEVTLDRTLQRMALQQMWQDPGHVLRLAGVKFLRTWSLTPNVAQYRHGAKAIISAAYTVVVLLGAAAGIAAVLFGGRRMNAAPRRKLRRFHLLLWLPVVYFTLVHCVYVGSVRYRVPLMPLVAVAAATASIQLSTRRTETRLGA